MTEENKRLGKEVNPEIEEKIKDKMAHMIEAEDEDEQEIDFIEADVSGGRAWECGGNYKT